MNKNKTTYEEYLILKNMYQTHIKNLEEIIKKQELLIENIITIIENKIKKDEHY